MEYETQSVIVAGLTEHVRSSASPLDTFTPADISFDAGLLLQTILPQLLPQRAPVPAEEFGGLGAVASGGGESGADQWRFDEGQEIIVPRRGMGSRQVDSSLFCPVGDERS